MVASVGTTLVGPPRWWVCLVPFLWQRFDLAVDSVAFLVCLIIINILGFLVALNLTNIPYRNTTPTSPSSRGSRLESSISKYLISNLDFPCYALAD